MGPSAIAGLLALGLAVVGLIREWISRRNAAADSAAVAADLAAHDKASIQLDAIHEKAAEDRHRETSDRVDHVSDDLGYTGPRLGGAD
jgi:hypothetical protein